MAAMRLQYYPVMHTMRVRLNAAFLLQVALLCVTSSAFAQTGAPLLVKPWPEKDQVLDSRADAFIFNSGHTNETGHSFQLMAYETSGRVRVLPGNEISPRVGWDMTYLDLRTGSHRLPHQLSDESIAIGTGIAKYHDWVAGITLGLGYAGDNAFGNGAGWYGRFDLVVAREFTNHDALGLILDYDGHRTYLPDVPLPGFGYSHRFDPKLQMVVGAPFSSIDWKPIDRFELEAEYSLLTDLRATASYEFLKHWLAYGMFDYRRNAFHVSDLPHDRRLLFSQRRVEVGVRFQPIEQVRVNLGIGYGFLGEFRSGFDFEKTHRVEHFSDEPYIHAGAELRF